MPVNCTHDRSHVRGRCPPAEEAKQALFNKLAARYGERFSRSEALRTQHANTLTWLKVQVPDAVLFAETTEEVSEALAA